MANKSQLELSMNGGPYLRYKRKRGSKLAHVERILMMSGAGSHVFPRLPVARSPSADEPASSGRREGRP